MSLGPHVSGVVLPHPDLTDPLTAIAGINKRFAYAPPTPEPTFSSGLLEFSLSLCHKLFTPLSPSTDTSPETWLKSTSYPEWRKEQLRQAASDLDEGVFNRKKLYHNKSFVKQEFYPEYKHARAINSRSDAFKVMTGPIFKLIERHVFDSPHFVKKIPVRDRARFIKDRLKRNGGVYLATDYTAFESLFTRELMEQVEFAVYRYMTQHLPEGASFMQHVETALGGQNVCNFKHFTASVPATRMSGDMCTSLGNGLTNMICMFYVCEKLGCDFYDGIFEGDDGITVISGKVPTSEDFAKLGLNIKLEVHHELTEASFCGLVFDEEDCLVVTDPREVLATTAWAPNVYSGASVSKCKSLLRCKALSLAHQYPGCPIIQSYAVYLLRETASHDVRHLIRNWKNTYEREQLLSALASDLPLLDVPYRTRQLVERLYNIPIEAQHRIEDYFDSRVGLGPIDQPDLLESMPEVWKKNFDDYALHWPVGQRDNPPSIWSRCEQFALNLTVSHKRKNGE